MTKYKPYIFWFAQEHVSFRHAEISSLIKLFNIKPKKIEKSCDEVPYWIVELDDEKHVHSICSRSVSIRCCMELWARSKTSENLHKNLKEYLNSCGQDLTKYFDKNLSFKITVETFCKHLTQAQKVSKIEEFEYLPAKGPVKLTKPDVVFMYCEHYGLDANNIPEKPLELLFGRFICTGQRQLIKELSLKSRKFIGNTSMDATLSVLAANQALATSGKLIIDPFVGSGSLLVSAAKFGGYVMGMDIDYLMLHGRTKPSRITQKKREKDEGVLANLKQYSCESHYIDVIVADSSLPLWRTGFKIDAIITDPPYGIREATERIGVEQSSQMIDNEQPLKKSSSKTSLSDDGKEILEEHFPGKVEYNLPQLYSDLLHFAATHLQIGGRLVCWFPIYREDYDESMLPKHKELCLIANSEQILSRYASRRMLTYEKIADSEAEHLDQAGNEIADFRHKYFTHSEGTRKEKRLKRHEEQERTRLDKIKARLEKRHSLL